MKLGFEAIDQRFEAIEKKLDEHTESFAALSLEASTLKLKLLAPPHQEGFYHEDRTSINLI